MGCVCSKSGDDGSANDSNQQHGGGQAKAHQQQQQPIVNVIEPTASVSNARFDGYSDGYDAVSRADSADPSMINVLDEHGGMIRNDPRQHGATAGTTASEIDLSQYDQSVSMIVDRHAAVVDS